MWVRTTEQDIGLNVESNQYDKEQSFTGVLGYFIKEYIHLLYDSVLSGICVFQTVISDLNLLTVWHW